MDRAKLSAWIGLIACLLVHPLASTARAGPPLRLKLADAVRLALRRSTIIKDAGYDVAIARSRRVLARSAYFPQVELLAGSILLDEARRIDVPPGTVSFDLSSMGLPPIGNFDPSKPISNSKAINLKLTDQWINFGLLSLKQPLYTGGLITGYNRQARHGVEVARHGKRRRRQEVVALVVRRYNDLLLAKRSREVGQDALVKLNVLLDLTKRLYRSGAEKVTRLDYLRIRMLVSTVKTQHAKLRASERLALAGFKFAIGLEGTRRLEVTQTDFPRPSTNNSCEHQITRARRRRPEMGQIRNGIEALRAGVDVATSGYIPDLALVGGFLLDDKSLRFTDGHTFYGGLMLSFPLFEGFRTVAKVSEARARLHQLKNKKKLLHLGIGIQVRKACLDLQRTRSQVETTRAALSDAEEHLSLTRSGYQVDMVETSDLLQAQIMEALMRIQHLKARYDLSNSYVDLHLATGDLSAYHRKR